MQALYYMNGTHKMKIAKDAYRLIYVLNKTYSLTSLAISNSASQLAHFGEDA